MKLYVCTLVLSILTSISASATCSVPPSSQYECKGRKLVTNAQELSAYLENYNFNSNKQTVKGITLSGSFSGENLDIASPCPIHIQAGTSLNFTGDICLSSAKKVIGRDNLTINASNLTMTAPERVILNNNLNATISNQMSLISKGTSINSRAHIRHTSTINAGSLNVIALRRATLGHTSTYNISGKITLSSNGEDLPDDAELGNSEWSSIWRDTNITASELSITALERARIGRGVTITAPKTTISAKSCAFNKTAIFNSAQKLGDCFSGRHPIAKFKYSPKKEAQVGQTVLIDASQSTYLEGSRFFWSFYEGEDSVIRQETTIPSTSHAFTTLGKKKIELKLITPEGFYAIARRNITIIGDNPLLPPTSVLSANPSTGEAPLAITLDASASSDSDGSIVKYIFSDGTNFVETTEDRLTLVQETSGTFNYQVEIFDDSGLSSIATTEVVVTPQDTTGESAILPFFKYNLIPNGEFYKVELIYESRTLNGREITNAFYSAGPDTLPVGRRVLGHKDIIDFESPEPVDLTINVTDELGGTATFTHTINPIVEQQRPNLQIDSIEFNPNEVVFFSNLIFDPYNQLEGIERYNIDFGDGTSQEIDGPWFQINHQYPNAGLYNATLTAFGRNGESFSHNQEIEVVGSRASYELPIADFRVEQGDAFPGVRLYVDQSISPTAPIKQFLWNLGDDTTAYGSEVIHFYDAGAYDVTLTAILEDGSSSVVKREVIIMRDAPNMIGDVECFDEGDLKTICDFSALDRFGELSEVKIHFGDSEITESSIISVPTSGSFQEFAFEHQYQNAGTYRVVYQVLSSRGEVLDGETEVIVSEGSGNQPPIADLACYPSFDSVDCQAFGSIDYDGFITNYKFTFGNGESFETTDSQAFYTYPENGVYEITLEVTDNLGATSTTSQVVTIEEKPNEFPVPQLVCDSNNVQELTCNASSSYDSDGTIVGARITFLEDGEAFESSDFLSLNPIKSFATGGIKSVKLEVEDDQGALVEVVRDFEINENQAPFAFFVCASEVKNTISCDARSSQDDESITSYEWNIAGSVYYGETLSLSDIETQELDVSLTVKDRFNATESTTRTFQIQQNSPPYGSFTCLSSIPLNMKCEANYFDDDGAVTSYQWEVNGLSYAGKVIELNLPAGGPIEVSLTVEDDSSALNTSQKNIFVLTNTPPTASFVTDKEVYLRPSAIYLDASSSFDNDNNNLTYRWNFSDGTSSTGKLTNFTPNQDGAYTITLEVSDGFAQVEKTKAVIVTSKVNNEILVDNIDQELPSTFVFSPKEKIDPIGNPLQFTWLIDDVEFSKDEEINLLIQDIDDKKITLITEDIYGFSSEATRIISFNKPDNYFTLNLSSIQGIIDQEFNIVVNNYSFEENPDAVIEIINPENEDITITSSKKGSFSFTAKAQALGSLEVKLTNQGTEFTRLLKYEIVGDPVIPNIVEIPSGGYSIENEGVVLGTISAEIGRRLDIQEQVLSDGSVLVRIGGADLSEQGVSISSTGQSTDITMYDLRPSLLDGISPELDLSTSQLGGITVKYCPSENKWSKSFNISIGQFTHLIFRKWNGLKEEYYSSYIEGVENVELLIHSSGKSTFLKADSIDENKKTGSPNENNRIISVLLFAIKNQEALRDTKIYLGGDGFFNSLFPTNTNTPGLVIPGVRAIFLNERLISDWNIGFNSPFHTLVHENEHIAQNDSCRLIRKKSALPFVQARVLSESYSELKAFKAIQEKVKKVPNSFPNIIKYPRLTGEQKSDLEEAFTKDIRYLKEDGLRVNSDSAYKNEAFFFMLGLSYEAFLDKIIEDSIETGNEPSISYSLKSDFYVGGARQLLQDLNNNKFDLFGFDAKKASFPLEEDLSITIKPYGIATVQINQALIKEKKMFFFDYQTIVNRKFFRMETEKNDSLQVVAVDTTGAFARKTLSTIPSYTANTTVYSIANPVTSFADPNSEKNGFIGIINNSPQEQTFTILNMDNLCIQIEGQPTVRWSPTTRTCIPCDGRPSFIWNDQLKQCDKI